MLQDKKNTIITYFDDEISWCIDNQQSKKEMDVTLFYSEAAWNIKCFINFFFLIGLIKKILIKIENLTGHVEDTNRRHKAKTRRLQYKSKTKPIPLYEAKT